MSSVQKLGSLVWNNSSALEFGYQLLETGCIAWKNSSSDRFKKFSNIQKTFFMPNLVLGLVDLGLLMYYSERKWSIFSRLRIESIYAANGFVGQRKADFSGVV